jgi:UDP-N-acetylglucosamine 2-epimerase (non-hydrolysing)
MTENHEAAARRKVMVVYGTRPEAVKMAPVVHALRTHESLEPVVAVTGQHRAMLDQVNEFFGIVPDIDLDIHLPGQTLTDVTTRTLLGLSGELSQASPDLLVVQGDTTTTFVSALAAFYAGIPVVHMEAGLRTGDPLSPFPEEINRRLTTQLTALHLPPTTRSRENLLREGVDPDAVVVTGNTVIDALHWTIRRTAASAPDRELPVDVGAGPVLLVTAHRRESWGEPMRQIGQALRRIALCLPHLTVVFPMHANPLVREAIVPAVLGLPNVVLCDPLDYADFARLMNRATVVLTDSGGVQEEAPSLGKPVLVMRDTTERPEAVDAGTVRLVGTDADEIVRSVRRLLTDQRAYDAMARAVNPYGDGRAGERTVAAVAHYLGVGPAPEQFVPPHIKESLCLVG